MEIITNFWVLFFFWDINETMYVNEVQKLNNNLYYIWLCLTYNIIAQWPRVSRGSLAMCHKPCETSCQDCLGALFYYIMRTPEWADFLVLGPPQGSGVTLLEDLHPSSSFCPSSVAFSFLMVSVFHNSQPVTCTDQKTISKNSLTQLSPFFWWLSNLCL